MALTPEQASQLTPSDYDQVQALEKDIDAKLLTGFSVASQEFQYTFLQKESKYKLKVIFEVQRRYDVAGWSTSLTREGEDVFSITLVAPAVIAPQMTAHKHLMAKDAD
jgi:hypothetical protein